MMLGLAAEIYWRGNVLWMTGGALAGGGVGGDLRHRFVHLPSHSQQTPNEYEPISVRREATSFSWWPSQLEVSQAQGVYDDRDAAEGHRESGDHRV